MSATKSPLPPRHGYRSATSKQSSLISRPRWSARVRPRSPIARNISVQEVGAARRWPPASANRASVNGNLSTDKGEKRDQDPCSYVRNGGLAQTHRRRLLGARGWRAGGGFAVVSADCSRGDFRASKKRGERTRQLADQSQDL